MQGGTCRVEFVAAGGEVDRVVAVAPVGGASVGGDEAAVSKETQVVRHQVLRLVDEGHQLLDGSIAADQLL